MRACACLSIIHGATPPTRLFAGQYNDLAGRTFDTAATSLYSICFSYCGHGMETFMLRFRRKRQKVGIQPYIGTTTIPSLYSINPGKYIAVFGSYTSQSACACMKLPQKFVFLNSLSRILRIYHFWNITMT